MKPRLFQSYTHQYNCICRRCSSYYQELIKVNFDCVGKRHLNKTFVHLKIHCAALNTWKLAMSYPTSSFLFIHTTHKNNYCNWRLMKNHLLDLPTMWLAWFQLCALCKSRHYFVYHSSGFAQGMNLAMWLIQQAIGFYAANPKVFSLLFNKQYKQQ